MWAPPSSFDDDDVSEQAHAAAFKRAYRSASRTHQQEEGIPPSNLMSASNTILGRETLEGWCPIFETYVTFVLALD
jgi:hypothetical protein